ncbi:hypothetical protein G7092_09570 [Mucilaginibacter sp. HC2]|uniref:hypothetical protein n=1 Tax=Mucilaginibacter inviolabilis TaxID=2714892 RepID=UPI00140D0AEB|nr:hypothetical protein [Mucilaginibacter inviolabilis]NHA04045.1 hypothetical protein [Mucilaginibacter inviolabilis]
MKSNQKSSQQRGFFALTALALQNGQNQGCNYFALLRSLTSPGFSKNLLCPAAAQSTIVLPAFARSLSADGGKKESLLQYVCHAERSEASIKRYAF